MKKIIQFPGAPTPEEALRFESIAQELMRTSLGSRQGQAGIGTLHEKRIHMALKAYFCPDSSCHERPVPAIRADEEASPSSRRNSMVADIRTHDGHIYEIQTGGFYPLKKKVAWYLAHTDDTVTVVHPMPAAKYISWMDPADGQILSRHKSPKCGRVTDIAGELYWLSDFVGHPRFSICLLFLDMEEYRLKNGWGNMGKRGSSRYERFPTALRGRVDLVTPTDYAAYFLPPSLPEVPFTAATYAKLSGIRGRATYGMLHLLVRLSLLAEAEKQQRSQCYTRLPVSATGTPIAGTPAADMPEAVSAKENPAEKR